MAGDPDIDAIYIATPNALHAEQALRVIAHGKAVLVEKPLATSVADAERIASAAASRKCFAMEAMWTRFLPAVRAAKKLVETARSARSARIDAELSYHRDEDGDSRFFKPGPRRRRGARPRRLSRVAGAALPGQTVRKSPGAGKRRKAASTCAANSTCNSPAREARLSCGFDRDGANQFVIEGSEGVLRLEAPFLKAQRLMRFHARGLP